MAGIFMSYRRADSDGWAGRLRDALRVRFGDRVFQDVESIADGEIFSEVIDRALKECDVALVIIGPNWASARDESGRRLDQADDWVRTETALVLDRQIRVIPVLVGGATMPRPEDLPEDLRSLTKRQAREIRSNSWDSDVALLTNHLRQIVGARRKRPMWLYAGAPLAVVAAIGVFGASRYFAEPGIAPAPAERSASPAAAPAMKAEPAAPVATPAPVAPPAPVAAPAPVAPPPATTAAASKTPAAASAPAPERASPKVARAEAPPARAPSASPSPAPRTIAAARAPAASKPAIVPAPEPRKPSASLAGAEAPPAPTPAPAIAPEAKPREVAPAAAPAAPAAAPVVVARAAPLNLPNRPASARELKVGDSWTYRLREAQFDRNLATVTHEIGGGDKSGIREVVRAGGRKAADTGEAAGAQRRLALEPRIFEQQINQNARLVEFAPFMSAFAELKPGVKWNRIAGATSADSGNDWRFSGKVAGRERVRVPAGTFDSIKAELEGELEGSFPSSRDPFNETTPSYQTYSVWYVPEVGRAVKYERRTYNRGRRLLDHEQYELLSYQLK